MIKAILREYGILWIINRVLYSIKLKLLIRIPKLENIFEKKILPIGRLGLLKINIKEIKLFLQKLPNEKQEELIRIADDATNGIIKAFSSIRLNYGSPIEWQLNPITGEKCNINNKWFQILDFDEKRGDIKIIWEISRFSHFCYLTRAFLLTENKKYYKSFSKQLNEWIEKNPYSYGANYKCGQECSLRMANALLAYTVFSSYGLTTKNDEKNIKKLIEDSYKKILSNFFYTYRCIKNNHTISELLGMIIGAWCSNDNKQLDRAYKLLDEVIDKQFLRDGGYIQYSFNYQRLVLQDVEYILSISKNIGRELSKKSKEKILKSTILLYQCQNELGDVPNYGSNDGALVFPLTSCGYRDFRPTINSIYRLITNKQIYKPGIYEEDYLWFSGVEESSASFLNIERNSSKFSEIGLYTIRDEKIFLMLVLNEYKSRPAQMDQLHLDLWMDGKNILCDSGTYSYASEIGKELASTSGHNTFVSNIEQMKKYSIFLIYDWIEAKLNDYNQNFFSGEMLSKNGYSHQRKLTITEEGFNLFDSVEFFKKDIRGYFYFYTPCNVKIKGNKVFLFNQEELICSIEGDSIPIIQKGKRSIYYLKYEEINLIKFPGIKIENKVASKIKFIYKKGERKNG